MSFSEECKIELWEEEPPKKPCCRRALMLGLLFCAEEHGGVFRLNVPEAEQLGSRVAAFLEKQLHTSVKQTPFFHVGRAYTALTLLSRATCAQFQRADMSDLPLSRLLGFDCEACVRYFLRGALLRQAASPIPPRHAICSFPAAMARRHGVCLSC